VYIRIERERERKEWQWWRKDEIWNPHTAAAIETGRVCAGSRSTSPAKKEEEDRSHSQKETNIPWDCLMCHVCIDPNWKWYQLIKPKRKKETRASKIYRKRRLIYLLYRGHRGALAFDF
jgi:hypothetical protein